MRTIAAAALSASRASFVACLLLLSAACSRSPAPPAGPSPAASADSTGGGPSRAITVEVDNQNFNDMNVYLIHEGSKWLVGHAPGLKQTTLTIPAGVAPVDQRVTLRAEAIGGAGATTTPLLVVPPGQAVHWAIGADLSTSTASAG
jgi:hypothetical protein